MFSKLRYYNWDFSSTAEAVIGVLLMMAVVAIAFV
jgi:hypothetical protein